LLEALRRLDDRKVPIAETNRRRGELALLVWLSQAKLRAGASPRPRTSGRTRDAVTRQAAAGRRVSPPPAIRFHRRRSTSASRRWRGDARRVS